MPRIIAPTAAPWTNATTVEPRKNPQSQTRRMRSLRKRNSNAMPRKIRPNSSNSTGKSVGWRTYDRLGGDIAGGSRPVFHDERLAQPLRQPMPDQTREGVGPAAGRKANNDAHWPRRIGLRPRNIRRRPARR